MLTNTVLLLATLIGGQTKEANDCCCLSKLEVFMGGWEAKEIEIEGKKCTVTGAWRPSLDGKFIEHRWAATDPEGNRVTSGLAMIGQDPSKEKIQMWGFAGNGDPFVNTLAKRDGAKFSWTSNKDQSSIDYEVIGEDAFRWSFQKDGQVGSISFKRLGTKETVSCPKPTAELPANADQKLKEIAWWVGDFTMTGTDASAGKPMAGRSRCGWTLDGRFLLYDNTTVDTHLAVGRYRAVIGLDPATGKVTGWEFDSRGGVGKYTVSNKGQDIEGKSVSPDAGVFKYTGTITPTENGLDYQAKGELATGEIRPYHWVWTKD